MNNTLKPHSGIIQIIINYLNLDQLYDFFISHDLDKNMKFKINIYLAVGQQWMSHKSTFEVEKFKLEQLWDSDSLECKYNYLVHNIFPEDEDIECIEYIFPNVDITHADLPDNHLRKITQKSQEKNIESLHISYTHTTSCVYIPNLPKLKIISLTSFDDKLEKFKFENNDHIDNIDYLCVSSCDLYRSIISNFINLQYLTLHDVALMPVLPMMPKKLLYLDLINCNSLFDIENILLCYKLEHLSITKCTKLKNVSAIAKCKQLKSLRLIKNSNLEYTFLQYINNLKKLVIATNELKSIPLIPLSVIHLTLQLPYCNHFDNLSLFPNLMYLKLYLPMTLILPNLSCADLKYLDLRYFGYNYDHYEDVSSLSICTKLCDVDVSSSVYNLIKKLNIITQNSINSIVEI